MDSNEKTKQIKELISNNEQIPLSLIKNDFSFLKELNDEELDEVMNMAELVHEKKAEKSNKQDVPNL